MISPQESADAVRELSRSMSHLSALASTRGPSFCPSPLEAPTASASDPLLYTLAGAVFAIGATLPSHRGGGHHDGESGDMGTIDAVTRELSMYVITLSLLPFV